MDDSGKIKWLGIGFGIVILAVLIVSIVTADRTVTVTYDLGYEERVESETVDKGLVEAPNEPFRFGYVFEGWFYTDKSGEEIQWDFSTDKVKKDVTLYAKWTLPTYTVTFRTNGGVCEMQTMQVACGEPYILPEATREGYYFAGWYGFGETLKQEGTWSIEQDCVLSAKWATYPLGMVIVFGAYEQDNVESNGKEPIEWLVIDYKDGQYLLLPQYVLDAIPMSTDRSQVNYRDCNLRHWLGDTFLHEAFTEEEQAYLVPTYLKDVDLTETVFLLNSDEASSMLYSKEMAYGLGTEYAKEQNLEVNCGIPLIYSTWWIRHSRDSYQDFSWAMIGSSTTTGGNLLGVRPAVWLDESALADGVARVK